MVLDQTYAAPCLHTHTYLPPRAATAPGHRVLESQEEAEEAEEAEAEMGSGMVLEETPLSKVYKAGARTSLVSEVYTAGARISLLLMRSKTRGRRGASAAEALPQATRALTSTGGRISPSLPWLGRVLVARL